ncbi:uncharacterized protein G2W53_015532 [Senna tora]|uniref:Uncharacterized protein n=1 Tax=Senna tora TaxID=362788 RepID=A0A834WVH0_9FABA|nr:uncharacterized protein G2W53_015532 [Senna tora]
MIINGGNACHSFKHKQCEYKEKRGFSYDSRHTCDHKP